MALFDAMEDGTIPKSDYVEGLKSLDCVFMSELLAVSEDWTCACGESSPISFLECWSCGATKPGVEIDEDSIEAGPINVNLPPRGGNAWEL